MCDDAEEEQPDPSAAVPSGFFDDPVRDAEVRKIDLEKKKEEEFAAFQKEIAKVPDHLVLYSCYTRLKGCIPLQFRSRFEGNS